MKRILLSVLIIILILEILMFPKEAMNYASIGITLWLNNMIPALFPFMVISGLIVQLNLVPYIIGLLHPVLHKLYHTNLYCEYTIVMGFLCGYPMGAVIVRDLLAQKQITPKQAEFLLSFCNNIGPVFFCSLVLPIFETKYHPLLLAGMYGIPLLYGLFLRYTFYQKAFIQTNTTYRNKMDKNLSSSDNTAFAKAFTDSLNRAVETALLLGACMIFFNMLRFLPMHFIQNNLLAQGISSWLLEANGALFLTKDFYKMGLKMTSLLLIPFLSIGGLSCLCQTASILSGTNYNFIKYIMHKVIQWLLWLFITLLWLLIENLWLFYSWSGSV